LIVLDHARPQRGPLLRLRPEMVGTYRLLRQEIADRHGGLLQRGEYESAPPGAQAHTCGSRTRPLLRTEPYRTSRTVELLWQGIWRYRLRHRST
jgi:putative hemolysin